MSQARPTESGVAGTGKVLARLLDILTRLSLYLSALFLFLLLFCYVYEVVVRYFLNAPTSWTFDLGTWFLAASIMLALPEVTRLQANISISFILEKLPAESRALAWRIISLLAFFFCLLTAWVCFGETARQFAQNIETYWNHPVPKWWVSSVIPFGLALSGLQFLRFGLRPPRIGS